MRSMTVGQAIDLFLSHKADIAKASTVAFNRSFLRDFRAVAGAKQLSAVTPALLDHWIAQRHGENSQNTQRNAGRCVRELIHWAVAEGRLDRSPLARHRLPAETSRERVLSDEEYDALLAAALGTVMQEAIPFLWHTGCRPQEFRVIEAKWMRKDTITFPAGDSKGTRFRRRKRRVIYLDQPALALATAAAGQYPKGPIWRGRHKNEWTKDALKNAFARVRDRTGLPDVCPYTLRHSRITRWLEKGLPVATVAALAGSSPATIMRVYCHVSDNAEHLRRAVG